MNTKKLVITIIIDLLALALFLVSVYALMFRELNQWQNNIATVVAVISLPTIFYSVFTQLTFKKYGDMQMKDEKRWDREDETENLESDKKAL